MKHREERVVGGEVKPTTTMFGEEEEEDPQVLYDKVSSYPNPPSTTITLLLLIIGVYSATNVHGGEQCCHDREERKEITAIVQSISEINEMYRDLATMVVDQVGYRNLS